MKFMLMHKNDPKSEAGEKPSMKLIEEMGEFIGGFVKSGKLIDGAGLSSSASRTRVTFRGGQPTVKRGPYKGERELPASMLLLKVKTREEAMGWVERYGKVIGDGEVELGKVNEPWDLGIVPMPENPPLQMLLIDKADKDTEAGGRSSQVKAGISRLKTEMAKAGVLVRSLDLAPSKQAKRLHFVNNDLRVVDGPFTESVELIGGFAVIELEGFDEAIALSRRYTEILGGTLEIDLRVVDAVESFPQ